MTDGRELDPDHIESIVLQRQADGSERVVTAMYILERGKTMADVPDVAGPLTTWHDHQNLCWDAKREARRHRRERQCRPGGTFRATAPMMHVWLTDPPCGPFSGVKVTVPRTAPTCTRPRDRSRPRACRSEVVEQLADASRSCRMPSSSGSSSACSSAHVLTLGMKTARSPAARAGATSDFGELPIIQLVAGSSSWCASEVAVRVDVLLGDDVHVLEVGRQRRGVDLALLLVGRALGQQQQAVTGAEHGEGLDDAGERRHVVFEQRHARARRSPPARRRWPAAR